ncbi:OmpP1/FadL family transporter [Pontibacter vulgaris]|uniref:OmpP1/FadL family transporter n=1 Tax=Pontibacter vulgaris TaxID=2905679 RepID=UPI001FA7E4C3|nr:outer membrane protein transport protein [Pontibacter vulgaris]
MRINKIFSASLALLLGWSGTALAQNEIDALRYTRLGITGSARIQGIGGAQTALGADISTIGVNPAGLGMFRRSEANLGIGFENNTTDSRFLGQTTPDERTTISIPHAGVVFSKRRSDDDTSSDWRGTTFGIGITRLNSFNNRTFYKGTTGPNDATILNYFAEQAYLNNRTAADLDDEFDNGITSLEGLAYGTYLLNFGSDGLPIDTLSNNISIAEELERRGSQNQFDFAFGASFRDKVYLGASLGIITSSFTQERIYRESDSDVTTDFTSLELRDEFTTEGSGANLKVGVIIKPVDAFRFGLSLQTPTWYTFNEAYDRSLYSTLQSNGGPVENYSASELPGEFTYRLTTPFKANGGVAVFLSKYGFVTADVEYIDYSSMRFSNDDSDGYGSYFSGVNSRIDDLYKSALNYKIGAEGRYEVFRLRAGYAVSASPYKNSSLDAKINTLTVGAGVRLQKYYADVAFTHSSGKKQYSPYTFEDATFDPIVDLDNKQNNVMFTVGYNF